jgi:hypothetical protein
MPGYSTGMLFADARDAIAEIRRLRRMLHHAVDHPPKGSAAPVPASPQPALPPELLEVLANQPAHVNRKTGAALVTQHMYPVSYRSLEQWKLPTRRVNGRALIPTATLFEVAYAKFVDAAVVMGGRG